MSERTVTKEELKLAIDAATAEYNVQMSSKARGSAYGLGNKAVGHAVTAALRALGFTKETSK